MRRVATLCQSVNDSLLTEFRESFGEVLKDTPPPLAGQSCSVKLLQTWHLAPLANKRQDQPCVTSLCPLLELEHMEGEEEEEEDEPHPLKLITGQSSTDDEMSNKS